MEKVVGFLKKNYLGILFILCVLICLFAPHLFAQSQPSSSDARECAEKALEAILQDDVALWEEAIHPVYGPSFSSITFVKKDILATGIDVNNYGLGSVTIVKYDVSDGSAIAAEFDLKITDGIWVKNRDILRIVYQESENGKGIIEIKLIDLP